MINEKKTVEFPKRRKANDNPYTLGFNEDMQQYTVTFKDSFGEKQVIIISEKLYLSFDQFELDDLHILNEYDRHIEHLELTELDLHFRTKNIKDDEFISLERKLDYEKIKKFSSQLTSVQRRRIRMYYFEGLNFRQIGEIEHCTSQIAGKSIRLAMKKLKKLFLEG